MPVVAALVGSILFASCSSDQSAESSPTGSTAATSSPATTPVAPDGNELDPDHLRTNLDRAGVIDASSRLDSLGERCGHGRRHNRPLAGPNATVDVTIVEDNATVRSLLSRIPLTVEFEEFNGREKISYPPGGLDVVESGHDSENGDLIYYVPWGNLGFYYNAAGIEFDRNVVLLGRYDATPEQLLGLAGDVSMSIVSG